jgi:mRNA-degrading endonuclease HigB of HigAB toxin-antitoxin module
MRVIARKTLRDFYDRLADSKPTREAWFHEAIASR